MKDTINGFQASDALARLGTIGLNVVNVVNG